jgi:DNA-directed RNA polymerase specialized sigma24 family protein
MEPAAAPLFPVTAWTLVRRVQQGGVPQSAQQALDSLCRTYWEPVRKYLIALGCREQDTADVTQDFFASFLRTGGFDKADPGIAKLRTFIKHAAGRFLQNHRRKLRAECRGSGQADASLDDIPEPPAQDLALAAQSYDHDWAQTVLDRALTTLEQGYTARGKADVFAAIKTGLLRSGGVENAPAVALALGIPEAQVRLAVHRARQRLADALRAEVAATLEVGADADDEVRYLLSVIARAS